MAQDFSPPASTTSAAAASTSQHLFHPSNSQPASPKSEAMNHAGDTAAAEGPSRSPLDKPLIELTEEDIAQLTREDCRRFLKAKGMRRPSWNKSQAIQQVISLKALLEGRPGCDDSPIGTGILCKPSTATPPDSPPQDTVRLSGKEAHGESQLPAMVSAKKPSPYRRRDPIPPFLFAGHSPSHVAVAGRDRRRFSPRVTAEVPAKGQMTIFYDEKVNVFDGVTTEQARLIMEIAGSPVPYDSLSVPGPVPSARPPVPVFPVSAAPNAGVLPKTSLTGLMLAHHVADVSEDWRAPRIKESECFASRKASLQRYFEKKKDRFKGKKIISGSASASMEMICLTQTFKYQNTREQLGTSDMSPTLPQPPGTPIRSNSTEIRYRKERVSIDLNEEDSNFLG